MKQQGSLQLELEPWKPQDSQYNVEHSKRVRLNLMEQCNLKTAF